MQKRLLGWVAAALVAIGCGDDEDKDTSCKVGDASTCAAGLVCEEVRGGEPACFAPVQIRGQVVDLLSGEPVAGARVMAEEAAGRPVGDVAITDGAGNYVLPIPTARADAKGTPVAQTLRMSAAAQDYRPFPSGFRVALPVETAAAEKAADAFVVRGAGTSIGLEILPEERRGLPSIAGRVRLAPGHREAMVAAEPVTDATLPTVTARTDRQGDYVLFNVAPGSYAVRAFQRGANHTPAEVGVDEDPLTGVDLPLADVPAATLSGDVSIVAATGATSIVLALESTFDPVLARGVLVPGLRSPDPGLAPDVTGAFTIAGIPDGDYVVLAAFENDGLVRDPDPDIAGTEVQHISVRDGTVDGTVAFKVTGAVRMIGPGAAGASQGVEVVEGVPTFRWEAYPSAKDHLVELFDTFGNKVWEGRTAGTSLPYDGAEELVTGSPYLWRATAFGNAGNPIAMTEDLLGVFTVAQESTVAP